MASYGPARASRKHAGEASKRPYSRPPTSPSKQGTRPRMTEKVVQILTKWFLAHYAHPYPTEQEKEALAAEAGITSSQVNYWMIKYAAY